MMRRNVSYVMLIKDEKIRISTAKRPLTELKERKKKEREGGTDCRKGIQEETDGRN